MRVLATRVIALLRLSRCLPLEAAEALVPESARSINLTSI
jgi:hypothetical protein